jgi:uncharacterized protein (DUF302 family)
MKKFFKVFSITLITLFVVGCGATAQPEEAQSAKSAKSMVDQSVQVYEADNKEGNITAASIEEAFIASGLQVDGNNNMNKPFELNFKSTHYKLYHLATFRNHELSLKLLKKYPNFGLLTPLSMSIWSDDKKGTIRVSTLTHAGMVRTTGISADDEDLLSYANLVTKALETALPNGNFVVLTHTVKESANSFAQEFQIEVEEGEEIEDVKSNFEEMFEGEMEAMGFKLPNYVDVYDEYFSEDGYDTFDFYVTYSICKFDVIFPVSKLHPEAGAYAPCSMYAYKKKGEDVIKVGYLGVDNWITTLDVEDQESIKPLKEAQDYINNILTEMGE